MRVVNLLFFGFYLGNTGCSYWDWTTLVLKKCIRRHIKQNSSLLDIGTGYTGVLSIVKRNYPTVNVTGIDLFIDIILSAKKKL